jgi:hypothetical protein
LLSKEKEPSYRFRVTSAVCAGPDLLVIVPWVLENAVSGAPIIFTPYVKMAKYVAEYRNYWWSSLRKSDDDRRIIIPSGVTPYPQGRENIEDKPVYDHGNNFGRIARTEIMDSYVHDCNAIKVSGIEVNHWVNFLLEERQIRRNRAL